MTEHPNVGLVKSVYEAFSKGDTAAIAGLFTDDVVFHIPGDNVVSGDHKGKAAVFSVFARLPGLTDGTWRTEMHDVMANDEHAVALARAKASRNGKQLDLLVTHIYHMRDGKIAEAWLFAEDQRITEEFWSD